MRRKSGPRDTRHVVWKIGCRRALVAIHHNHVTRGWERCRKHDRHRRANRNEADAPLENLAVAREVRNLEVPSGARRLLICPGHATKPTRRASQSIQRRRPSGRGTHPSISSGARVRCGACNAAGATVPSGTLRPRARRSSGVSSRASRSFGAGHTCASGPRYPRCACCPRWTSQMTRDACRTGGSGNPRGPGHADVSSHTRWASGSRRRRRSSRTNGVNDGPRDIRRGAAYQYRHGLMPPCDPVDRRRYGEIGIDDAPGRPDAGHPHATAAAIETCGREQH